MNNGLDAMVLKIIFADFNEKYGPVAQLDRASGFKMGRVIERKTTEVKQTER